MKDVELIGMLKTYVKASLEGAGALKGDTGNGIASIEKTGTSGLVDTYTITYTNGQTKTYTVTNGANGTDGDDGVGITKIEKTSTSGNVDTYTITLSNNTTYTFTVTNGSGGAISELTDVTLNSLQDGQILIWDSTANKWKNGANSATVASLNNIGDVATSSVADGQVLIWDDTAGKWVNQSLGAAAYSNSFNDLNDKPTIPTVPVKEVKVNGTALTPDSDGAVNVQAITSVAVNGVSQSASSGAVNIDVASNLITETQWSSIEALLA